MPDNSEKPDETENSQPASSSVPEAGTPSDTPDEVDHGDVTDEGGSEVDVATSEADVNTDDVVADLGGDAVTTPDEEAQSTPVPAKRAGGRWLGIAGLVVLLVVGGAAYVTYPWNGVFNTGSDPAALAAISDKVSALETRVRKLETISPDSVADNAAVSDLQSKLAKLETQLAELAARPAQPNQPDLSDEELSSPPTTDGADPRLAAALDMVASLEARVDQLDAGGTDILQQRLGAIETLIAETDAAGRLDSVEGNLSDAARQGDLASLEGRITALESGNDARLMRAASLAMAAANLSRAATGSDPFVHELTVIRALAPDQAQLDALSTHAETGLPTVASLRAEFPAFGRAAIRADRLAGASGWWESLLANLQTLVTVRSTEETDSETTIALVGRMENYLLDGQLIGALTTADRLSPAAQDAMASWLAQARPRADLEAAIADLNESVLAAIAASGGGQ